VKPEDMAKRIKEISKKLNDHEAQQCPLLRFDPHSLPKNEQQLFQKNNELFEEYQKTNDVTIILKNFSLFAKQAEVMLKHITDLYQHIVIREMCCIFDNINPEIIEYFFNLHFKNFQVDFAECITKLQTWTKEEEQEYLELLGKSEKIIIRFPEDSDYDTNKKLNKLKRGGS
jgi:hypothetical protein